MGAMKNKFKKLKEKRKEEELSCSECPTQSFYLPNNERENRKYINN